MPIVDRVTDALDRMRRAGTDLQDVEAKSATGGLPRSSLESVCAMANAGGGLLLLGISEELGFRPVPLDVRRIAAQLSQACLDELSPSVPVEIDIVEVEGMLVVAASVPAVPPQFGPVHIARLGPDRGSFIRVHDGDRRMSPSEVARARAAVGPAEAGEAEVLHAPVVFDPMRVTTLVDTVHRRGPEALRGASAEQLLLRLGAVVAGAEGGSRATVAGALCLAEYPQEYLPEVVVTVVGEGSAAGAVPMLDGPIPEQIPAATAATVALAEQARDGRPLPVDVVAAVREVVANALIHRDYGASARGAQVRILVSADRVVVTSPGGLAGDVLVEDLFVEPVTGTRNPRIARLVGLLGAGRRGAAAVGGIDPETGALAGRGGGLLWVAGAARRAGLVPPTVQADLRRVTVTLGLTPLLSPEVTQWLTETGGDGLTPTARTVLAAARLRERVTMQDLRVATGLDAPGVAVVVGELVRAGRLRGDIDRRGWTSVAQPRDEPPQRLSPAASEPRSV